MICPYCNQTIPDNSTSCPFCGVTFEPQQEPQYSQETTVLSDMQYPGYEQPQQTQYAEGTTVLSDMQYPGYEQPAQPEQPQYQQYAQPEQPQYQQYAQPQQPAAQPVPPYAQQPQGAYAPQPGYYQQPMPPVGQLKTNRGLLKTILLSLITFGIYALVVTYGVTEDVNTVCSRYDNRKSMNYLLLLFIVAPLTGGIASIVWMHNICDRIGNELKRRGIDYNFGAKDFWLWGVLGTFIVVGPFIFVHKFLTGSNKINEHYNQFG